MDLAFRDNSGLGLAYLFPTGKVPSVRKIDALLRFNRLHSTILPLKKNAFAVGFFFQCQPTPVLAQTSEFLDELDFRDSLEAGQTRDFSIGQDDLAGPSTAGRASLTLVKNWHRDIVTAQHTI